VERLLARRFENMNNRLLNFSSRAGLHKARGLLLRFYDLTDYHFSDYSSTVDRVRCFASGSECRKAGLSSGHKGFRGSAGKGGTRMAANA
jgi:hypothetical protein